MIRGGTLALVAVLATALPPPARAANDDALVAQFFGIWDDNAQVTLANVRSLYADRVVYYGQSMMAEGVFANKLRFVRRWPERHYGLVPDTVTKACDAGELLCRVSAVLAYSDASGDRSARGRTRVTFDLVRQDGELKIIRESGRPVR